MTETPIMIGYASSCRRKFWYIMCNEAPFPISPPVSGNDLLIIDSDLDPTPFFPSVNHFHQ